jgi:hypothetical protein
MSNRPAAGGGGAAHTIAPGGAAPFGVTGRQRRLLQLRDELAAVRAALDSVSAAGQTLAGAEAERRLTAEEHERAARLGTEGARLRWELRRLWLEFEVLRSERWSAG